MKAFIIALYVLLFITVVLAITLPLVLTSKSLGKTLGPSGQHLRLDSKKMLPLNIAVCTPVRDCEKYLPRVFENIDRLRPYFKSLHCIFVYDNCSDNSAKLLQAYNRPNVIVYHNVGNNSDIRTERIASSRNVCVDLLYNHLTDIDYHIMFDADDRNVDPWRIDVLLESLQRDDWDCLSFHEPKYYDIWALIYGKFKHHCYGWVDKVDGNVPKMDGPGVHTKVIAHMQEDIHKKLKELPSPEHLLEVTSAFNSFALYRTPVFEGIRYDGSYPAIKQYLSDQDRAETLEYLKQALAPEDAKRLVLLEDYPGLVEHIYYHMKAIKDKGARIRISPKYWRK